MNIQIAPKRMIKDAYVIWPWRDNDDVDLAFDLREGYLGLKPESSKAIYLYNFLGMCRPEEIQDIVENLTHILKPGGKLFIIEQDFDYVARNYVGGDLPLNEFNKDFNRETFLSQEECTKILDNNGFLSSEQQIWKDHKMFNAEHYQFILSGTKKKKK
jgi:predicted SAM-dependent methyltransferase